jgi:hypothetical protein
LAIEFRGRKRTPVNVRWGCTREPAGPTLRIAKKCARATAKGRFSLNRGGFS